MKKIWIDADPGVDDTLAIALLLEAPEQVELVGISTVFGNAAVEQTTRNALLLMEAAGKSEVIVAQGAHTPLIVPLDTSPYVHGENGMGNMALPAPKTVPDPRFAPQAMIDAILANPHQITLLLIGPLTNAALALMLEPKIVTLVKEVVIMGGAVFCPGNITPAAEANFCHDPHAAQQVLSAGWPITLAPLDVDNLAFLPQELVAKMAAADKPLAPFLAGSLPHYQAFLKSFGFKDTIDFPDVLAAAFLLWPEIFTLKDIPLFVETEGSCLGQSLPVLTGKWYQDLQDQREFTPDRTIKNIQVMVDIDFEMLITLMGSLLT